MVQEAKDNLHKNKQQTEEREGLLRLCIVKKSCSVVLRDIQ